MTHPLPLCMHSALDVMPEVDLDALSQNASLRHNVQKLAAQKYALLLLEEVCPILEKSGRLEVSLIYYDGPHPILDFLILTNREGRVVSTFEELGKRLNELCKYVVYAPDGKGPDGLSDYICNIFYPTTVFDDTKKLKKLIIEEYGVFFGPNAFDEWESLKGQKYLDESIPLPNNVKTGVYRL